MYDAHAHEDYIGIVKLLIVGHDENTSDENIFGDNISDYNISYDNIPDDNIYI